MGAGSGGRAPHGARGLKLPQSVRRIFARCRAPHGARGLKLILFWGLFLPEQSRPARGAWVETGKALPPEKKCKSRPARGAWVETRVAVAEKKERRVAPRTGRVG